MAGFALTYGHVPLTYARLTVPAMRCVLLLLVTTLVLLHPAQAQTPLTEHTLTADSLTVYPQASVNDFEWLVGTWRGDALGGVVDEIWLPPAGDAIMGTFRLTQGEAVAFYELWTLHEEPASWVLVLRHFEPDLRPWEDADSPVRFPLLRLEENRAYFDGLTYARTGEHTLQVWLAMYTQDGVREVPFTLQRTPLTGRDDAPASGAH